MQKAIGFLCIIGFFGWLTAADAQPPPSPTAGTQFDGTYALGAIFRLRPRDKGVVLLLVMAAVVDGAVAGKAPADRLVSAPLVSHQLAFGVGVPENDGSESARFQILCRDRSCRAAALDERNDRHTLR
jgi:hypothetical protein